MIAATPSELTRKCLADAAGGAGDDDAVAAEQLEIARHVGAEETGRLLLEHDNVARAGGDLVDDAVAVDGDRRAVVDRIAVVDSGDGGIVNDGDQTFPQYMTAVSI